MQILETKKVGKNKGLWFSIVLVVFCVMVVFVISFVYKLQNRGKVSTADRNREVVLAEELPTGMPVDLPFLAMGSPVQNYTTETSKDNISSRKLLVPNSLQEVKQAYLEYFSKFGFEVVTDYAGEGSAVLSAVKDSQNLNVSITDLQGKSMVELTVIENK